MKKIKSSQYLVLSLSLAASVIGCDFKRKNVNQTTLSSTTGLSAIIGKDDRALLENNSDRELKPEVVGMSVGNSHHCSGVLLSEKILLTALHCVENISVEEIQVKRGEQGQLQLTPVVRIIREEREKDLVWIELGNVKTEALVGQSIFENSEVDLNQKLELISFDSAQNNFLKSESQFGVEEIQPGFITYDADTVAGSSGSPIFIGGKLAGIHLGFLEVNNEIKNFGVLLTHKRSSLEELKVLYDVHLERSVELCGIALGSVNLFTYYVCHAAVVAIPASCTSGVGAPVCAAAIGVAAGVCGFDVALIWKAIGYCFK